jgi:hypothetical protein
MPSKKTRAAAASPRGAGQNLPTGITERDRKLGEIASGTPRPKNEGTTAESPRHVRG